MRTVCKELPIAAVLNQGARTVRTGTEPVPVRENRKTMNEHRVKRLVGYGLWLLGFLAFLPPALLNGSGPVSLYHFLLFNCLMICLIGGYLLQDAGNAALRRQAQGQRAEHVPVLGSPATRRRADKHFPEDVIAPPVLDDHRPDDMPAARSLVGLVLGLLAVGVLLAVLIGGPASRDALNEDGAKTEQGVAH